MAGTVRALTTRIARIPVGAQIAVRVAILVCIASAAGLVWERVRPRPLPPLEMGIWYWHTPFRLSGDEVRRLHSLGVRKLFVRTGTFRMDGPAVRLSLPQIWESRADGLDIHLVCNFARDVIRAFERLPNAPLAAAIHRAGELEVRRAVSSGLEVRGLQLDLDCPTRLLPKYADLLRRIRGSAPASRAHRLLLSITALPTWFTSREIERVLAAVDFAAPQYYEADVPHSLTRFATISRLSMMERGLTAAGRTGRPFYAGIPAYGHALVYDGGGRLVGTFRDAGIRDVERDGRFRLLRSFPMDQRGNRATRSTYVGEDLFDFAAPLSDRVSQPESGPPTSFGPYHLVFDLPSPTMLARHLAAVRRLRPRNCRGIIFFRYPEAGESQTLPLSAIEAALHGWPAHPALRIVVNASSLPWELIETGRRAGRPPLEATVAVENQGTASTFFAPDGVVVTLRFDRPGLGEIEPMHGSRVETLLADSGRVLLCSPRRANVLRIRVGQILAGERIRVARIRLPADGPSLVQGDWTAMDAGGFGAVQGMISPSPLLPSVDKAAAGGL